MYIIIKTDQKVTWAAQRRNYHLVQPALVFKYFQPNPCYCERSLHCWRHHASSQYQYKEDSQYIKWLQTRHHITYNGRAGSPREDLRLAMLWIPAVCLPGEGCSRCPYPLLHQAYSHLDRRTVLWGLWDRRASVDAWQKTLWDGTGQTTFNGTPKKEKAFVFRLCESRISKNIYSLWC